MAVWLTCGITVNSQNVNNNTSNVTAWVDANTNYGSYNLTGGAHGAVTFGGNASGTFNFNANFNKNATTRIYTRTFDVAHNADGTGSASFSVWFTTQVSSGTINGSASVTLPTIPRASTPTVSGTLQLGSQMTINTNRMSSGFTHTLRYRFNNGANTGTIASNVGASATYTPPLSFANSVTNAASFSFAVICDTYSGGTLIGTKETVITLQIPSSIVPSVSALTVSDATNYNSTYGRYIQGYSSIKAVATAAGSYGSKITSYRFEYGGNGAPELTAQGSASTQTLGTPLTSGTRTVLVTVTDSRGRTATRSASITVAAYNPPHITSFTAARWSTTTNDIDDESTTVRASVTAGGTATIGTVANSFTVVFYSKTSGSSSTWASKGSYTNTGASFTRAANLTGYSASLPYQFRVVVTDKLGNSVEQIVLVGTATPLLDFNADGDTIGMFRTSTHWVIGSQAGGGFDAGEEVRGLQMGDSITLNNAPLILYGTKKDGTSSITKFISHEERERFYGGAGSSGVVMTPMCYPGLTIANDQYLNFELEDKGVWAAMRANSSRYLQLFLLNGGLRGDVFTRIWSGTYNAQGAGALTIDGIQKYNLFAVMVETNRGDQMSAVCARRTAEDNIATGCCWWHNVNNYMYMVGVQMRLTSTGVSDMKATQFTHTGGNLVTEWCNSIKNVVGIL